MDFDEIAYDRNEATKTAWQHHMASIGGSITKLASKYCNDQPCYPYGICGGAFNYCIHVAFDSDEGVGAHWLMRFPIPGAVMYPEAKVRHEVAVMRYLYEKTSIPVPKIIAWGTAKDNIFEGVGPFIIMEFIEGESLYEVLSGVPLEDVFREKSAEERLKELKRKAEAEEGDDEVLSPDVDDATLEIIYRQMANVYLELADHDFDKIGSLVMTQGPESTWEVNGPPYTNLENELERACGVPKQDRRRPFHSASDYLLDLAQQKIRAMHLQRNILVDVEFGREAYVARHLFRATVPAYLDEHNEGPFKLVCDDLRPGNILVDRNLRITAICDWEWTYAAPYQQFSAAPRWLLLKAPGEWSLDEPYDGGEGDDDMLKAYARKLEMFLKIMEQEEHNRTAAKLSTPLVTADPDKSPSETDNTPVGWFHGYLDDDTSTLADGIETIIEKPFTPTHTLVGINKPESEPLSSLMRKSFTNGQFWFNECLRAYNFELLYWLRLHDLHYGPMSSVKEYVDKWCAIPINGHIEDFIKTKQYKTAVC